MPGLDDIWPDDPGDRVRYTVEMTRSPVSTTYVADRAEVTERVARRELSILAEEEWLIQTGADEWRVDAEQLGEDGLAPSENE